MLYLTLHTGKPVLQESAVLGQPVSKLNKNGYRGTERATIPRESGQLLASDNLLY